MKNCESQNEFFFFSLSPFSVVFLYCSSCRPLRVCPVVLKLKIPYWMLLKLRTSRSETFPNSISIANITKSWRKEKKWTKISWEFSLRNFKKIKSRYPSKHFQIHIERKTNNFTLLWCDGWRSCKLKSFDYMTSPLITFFLRLNVSKSFSHFIPSSHTQLR